MAMRSRQFAEERAGRPLPPGRLQLPAPLVGAAGRGAPGERRDDVERARGGARRGAEATVVLVGSGQIYGEADALPATEDAPLRPDNPYAVSKAACDMLGRQYADGYGMRVVRMRPFNHAGPGQSDEYVVSSLARQITEAEIRGGGVRAAHRQSRGRHGTSQTSAMSFERLCSSGRRRPGGIQRVQGKRGVGSRTGRDRQRPRSHARATRGRPVAPACARRADSLWLSQAAYGGMRLATRNPAGADSARHRRMVAKEAFTERTSGRLRTGLRWSERANLEVGEAGDV